MQVSSLSCVRVSWIFLLVAALLTRYLLGATLGGSITGTCMVCGVSAIVVTILVMHECKARSDRTADSQNDSSLNDELLHTIDQHQSEGIPREEEGEAGGELIESGFEDDEPTASVEEVYEPPRPKRQDLLYIDNVKIFLTILVVSHHITCAFGGCGNGWILIVGLYENSFTPFATAFVAINQAYFMPLFFFISAYFVPSSHHRKGSLAFLADKAKRYWIPAIVLTSVLNPLVLGICMWVVHDKFQYVPATMHTWFLFWLLIFNISYAHLSSASNPTEDRSYNAPPQETQTLPGPLWRLVYGSVVCGFGMAGIIIMIGVGGTFALMPIAQGSLINDILFFTAGTVAGRNGWLEGKLREQIGMPIAVLRLCSAVEGAILIALPPYITEIPILGIAWLVLAGVFCIDMSLVLLEWFQTHFNFQNRWMKILAEAAYTVYLIHPVIVVAVSALWVQVYESLGHKLEWSGFTSYTYIEGGGLTLGISWLCANVLVHLLVWPIAWFLRKAPGLRHIL